MIIYKVQDGASIVEFTNLIQAEFYASSKGIDVSTIQTEERQSSVDLYSIIDAALSAKQTAGLQLLKQIFVENTIAGINTEQSKELFRNHLDIIICILVGAFPTAYSMILEIQPYGFLTQERLNSWKAALEQHL
jgi:CRISPR/Cas system-associated protein Csx1